MSSSPPQPPADTIAAISTPTGRGGIGIVRLSGPGSRRIALAMLECPGPLEHARARYTRVLDPMRASGPDGDAPAVLDEAVVTAFHGPHSYTGEDVVEIATHGAPVILDAVLRGALAAGARLAEPGEFTQRAFVSGRLDLTQAEAVHDLIAARTLDQARQAAQQLGGALSRRLAPSKERLVHLVALLEAGMDFASGELDDVEVVAPAYIAGEIAALEAELSALAATFHRGHLLRQGASVALVGRPNAGKSSLFNRLLERERAIVTPLPGTTRDTVEESLALAGIPLRLIDTAGLRGEGTSTAAGDLDEAERLGIERSREALADADMVLLVHDATLDWSSEEDALLDGLRARPHLVVSNKADLLAHAGRADDNAPSAGSTAAARVLVSARTGDGLEGLRAAMLRVLHAEGSTAEGATLTTHRQHDALQSALAALRQAEDANAEALPHEVLLLDLHTALQSLDSLTGQTTSDDILARIFSTFCIGK